MIRAFTAGMIGSSSPTTSSVGCRISLQERQAAPAGAGGQLVVVAAPRAQPGLGVQRPGGPLGIGAHRAAVDLPGDAAGVVGVAVPARGEHPGQHPRVRPAPSASRSPVAASTSRRHPPPVLDGEVLGQPAAPGEPEDVDLARRTRAGSSMPGDDRAERGQVVGDDRPRGAAHPGDVEPDRRCAGGRGRRRRAAAPPGWRRCRSSAAAAARTGPSRAGPTTRSVRPADGDRPDVAPRPAGAGYLSKT